MHTFRHIFPKRVTYMSFEYSNTCIDFKEFYNYLSVSLVFILLFSMYRFGPYFVEPIVAGLDPKTNQPYISTMDLIGCPMETKDFVVGGTCTEQLYGMCESLWSPDMVRRRGEDFELQGRGPPSHVIFRISPYKWSHVFYGEFWLHYKCSLRSLALNYSLPY